MSGCFTCLNCGRINPVKGHSYTNKYCNNKCQQEHRGRQLVTDWKQKHDPWRTVPDWAKRYLIEQRGHKCEVCNGTEHSKKPIPLVVDYLDGDSYNNSEENLQLICPNCKSQK